MKILQLLEEVARRAFSSEAGGYHKGVIYIEPDENGKFDSLEVIQNVYDGMRFKTKRTAVKLARSYVLDDELSERLSFFLDFLTDETGFSKALSKEVGFPVSNSYEAPFVFTLFPKDKETRACLAAKLGDSLIVELDEKDLRELFDELFSTGKVRKFLKKLAAKIRKLVDEC